MIYSNAGHNPPLLVQHFSTRSATLLARTGPALGILDDVNWYQKQTRLAPGDVMVLYTDGITDAENADQAFYGLDRLMNVVQTGSRLSAANLLEAMIQDLHQFTGDTAQFDDIALMILQREG
jgi:serine phosphatase RsbU (regulator of sigma subunit)